MIEIKKTDLESSLISYGFSLGLGFIVGAIGSYFFNLQKTRSLIQENKKLENEIEKQKKLRSEERIGRISVQKKQRKQVVQKFIEEGITYRPIGFIESPFPDRRGTPRQPALVPAAKGFIRFNRKMIQFEHFEELKNFSHIWVIFTFHNNTNSEKANLASKIKPPRLHGQKVGCLSTRSPHRPNNIGLSVCEVVGVGPDYIEIKGLDMVDQTPVLDVKPYIPYDIVPMASTETVISEHIFSNSNQYFKKITPLKVPQWVIEPDINFLPVNFSSNAVKNLKLYVMENRLKFSYSFEELSDLITQILRQDIRSTHQGRASESNMNQIYSCRIDLFELKFSTNTNQIEVLDIELMSPAAN